MVSFADMEFPPRTNADLVKLAGIALFIFSFFPGLPAFIRTPEFAVGSFEDAFRYGIWNRSLVGFALALGWIDNFTVFFRLPRLATWFAILAPWLLYLALMFLNWNPGVAAPWPDVWVAGYWPFYPWALGIGLIHWARLLKSARREIPASP
jgi:hypothetical protein